MTTIAGNPLAGFNTQQALSSVIGASSNSLNKKAAAQFASNGSFNGNSNTRAMTTTVGSDFQNAAAQAATNAARSVSDKLNGALGGKLTSVLGAGGESTAGLAEAATKSVTNLATGAVSKMAMVGQNKLAGALTGALGQAAGGLLGGVLGGVQDSAAKNLAGSKIAPSFLETGPRDVTLVTDPFGVSDNNILNNVVDGALNLFQNAIDNLRQSPELLTDLATMTQAGEKNWAVDKDKMVQRVTGCMGGSPSFTTSFTPAVRDNVLNGAGIPDDIYDKIVTIVNDEVTEVNAGDVVLARQIYAMCNQIARHKDASKFFDIGAESALMAGVMREAIALGMFDAVELLIENAAHDEVAYNALYANMRVAVEYSDLDTINLMVERLGPAVFLARIPDAVQVLLQNYELPIGTVDSNYDAEWISLQACLDKLNPGWGRVRRGEDLIIDLAFYSALSGDARKLMLRDPAHQTATLVGSQYGPRDLIQELRQQYPLLPLTA